MQHPRVSALVVPRALGQAATGLLCPALVFLVKLALGLLLMEQILCRLVLIVSLVHGRTLWELRALQRACHAIQVLGRPSLERPRYNLV